jgi:predicted metal-dependent peptidase
VRALLPSDLGEPAGQLAEMYFRGRSGTRASSDAEARDCGSGVDGLVRAWDCKRPGLSALEGKLLAADTARRIREASRLRGDTPAGWQRWADEVLEPSVDWRRQLAVAVRRGLSVVNGRVDYSYARPSRRASAVPQVVLPTMRKPVPKVAVVVDTSGSMSDGMLGQALAEVAGLLRRVGVSGARDTVRLISCDAEAYEAQRVLDVRDVKLLGGGGTDMGAGLAAAAELRPSPDVIIVLTDGYTPWPEAAPAGSDVVVALLDPRGSVPQWATKVVVEPSPIEEAG